MSNEKQAPRSKTELGKATKNQITLPPVPEPPKPLIPLSGNYVTFPTTVDPLDQVLVGWWQNKVSHSATYYKLRCWFGKDDTTSKPPRFEPFGETYIFIAAEYFEPKYNGPVTTDKHILSLKTDARIEGEWVVAKLDRRFEYGQDKAIDTTKRWIVYHPPIAKEPPRVIHQHRFSNNAVVAVTDAVVKAGKTSGDWRIFALSTLIKGAAEVVKAKAGDPPHQFESENDSNLPAQFKMFADATNFNVSRRDVFKPEHPPQKLPDNEQEEFNAMYTVLKEQLSASRLRRDPRTKFGPMPVPDANDATQDGNVPKPVAQRELPKEPEKRHIQRRSTVGPGNTIGNVYEDEGARMPEGELTPAQKQALKDEAAASEERAKANREKERDFRIHRKGLMDGNKPSDTNPPLNPALGTGK